MNNNIKQFKKYRLVFEMLLSKDLHKMPYSPKMFRVEVRDKQVYDIVADDY